MSSVTATALADTLPSSIPKLDASGLNWAIFSLRFQDAVEAKGYWGHFDATEPRPVPTTSPSTEELAAVAQWDKDERSAKSLLTQKIPDSALIRIRNKKTVKERWDTIVTEFTEKGAFAQTDLRTRFLESKCPDKGNVRLFLDELRVKREELATVGVDIDEKDYRSTIISSLPYSLANFASNQLAAAKLYSSTKTITPDALISLISEEYERQQTQRARRNGGHGKSKDQDKDEALNVSPSGKSNGKGKFERKPRGVCWNCGEKGHYKDKCPKPTVDKKNDSPKPKAGTANAAIESDSEGEGAFFMEPESSDNDDDIPELEATSDSDEASVMGGYDSDQDESDWFSEVEENGTDSAWDTEELSGVDWSECGSFVDVDLDSVSAAKPEEFAAQVGVGKVDLPRAEIYDSGCSKHLTPYRDALKNFIEIPPKIFRAANKQTMTAVGVGEMVINVPDGTNVSQLKLTEVLYSPEVGYTLVSVGRLDEKGFEITFSGGKCTIKGPNGQRFGAVPKTKGLYRVAHDEPESAHVADEELTLDQFHRRMGHISTGVARRLVDKGFVTGVRLEPTPSGDPFFCESCVYAKATRKPVPKVREGERATKFGDEVHSDLWGPAPIETKGGRKYYITFTDDMSRLTHLYLLRLKSEAFEAFKQYEAWCMTHLGVAIKVLHSDRGGEYMDKSFILYLKSRGTEQRLTVHDTPAQNGVAERRNRTIVERVRALLHASGLPKFLWGEAARHVVWLMNRTSTKAVDGKTPFEAAFGKKPDLKDVREWGETVWVRIEGGTKLGGRVREGRWIGIDEQSKGVRIYWPDKKSVTVERNVYYDKTSASRPEGEINGIIGTKANAPIVPTVPSTSTSSPQTAVENPTSATPLQMPPPVSESASEDPPATKRIRKPSQRVADLLEGRGRTSNRPSDPVVTPGIQAPTTVVEEPTRLLEGEGQAEWMMWANSVEELLMAAETSEVEALEPRTLTEAKRRPDWPLWEKAINEELETLRKAGTWELTNPPPDANIVGSKWVFHAKKDAAGNVIRYKARLVAQGFSQVPGVDYFDTFAPVAKLAAIRSVLAMAAAEDLELHQIDIKGAYLNGELTDREVIFMQQPPGYHAPGSAHLVCRLRKTLYGLKQSGRRWYQRLVEIMLTHLGFSRCDVDQAVFFRREGKAIIVVLVHVDDCTIAATSITLITDFKARISEHVEITDLGELHWLLGIEIKRDREHRTIHLSQRSYIDSILRRYGLQDLKPVSIPMDTNIRLTTAQSPSTTTDIAQMRDVPYHEAVGSLMYAALGTRPDIAFAVQTASRFSTKPGPVHWEAVKRIFRYLKGTMELWLSYGMTKMDLTGYTDADGSMAEDRHAISGYAFLIHGGAVSWSAKRQEIIALSTTEAEYVAITHAAKEALWLRALLSQLFDLDLDSTTLFSDNKSAIELTKDHQYHARTKHIDIRFHFIRYIVENGSIRLVYCPTDDMVADTLTKALPSTKAKHFASQFGLSAP